MKEKHTPGPWKAYISGCTIAIDDSGKPGKGNVINWPGFDSCGVSLQTQKANALLIAAAPELLNALRDTLDALSGFENYNVWGGGDPKLNEIRKKTYKAMVLARRAIAKATGSKEEGLNHV